MPTVKCYSCGGSGIRSCPRCGGRRYEYRLNLNGEQQQSLCGHCGGRGGTPCYQCGGSGQLPIGISPDTSLEEPLEVEPVDASSMLENVVRSKDPELYKSLQESPSTLQLVIQSIQVGFFDQFVLNKGANNKTYRLKLEQGEWLMTPSSPYEYKQEIFRDYTQAYRERSDDDFHHSQHTAVRNEQGQFVNVDGGEDEIDLNDWM